MRWMTKARLADQVQAMGLPRRSVDKHLDSGLELRVDPCELLRLISIPKSFPIKSERRKATNVFLWQGDWDLTYADFRTTYRYRFIHDIWTNRSGLEQSEAYVDLNRMLAQGKPFRSHQKGILLNTPEKILQYLSIYIDYMKSMQRIGFDSTQGKDRLGVAIDRHGGIVKLNRGLHRLAMAQVLALEEITVRVRSVHADWWHDVTQGETGEKALERMVNALQECQPVSLELGSPTVR
ncbi:hypothetical protein [Modicisalibacter luteus]|uniref:Uncharacterized protein n=2 Tax=Modicisalibacter luteus TaxID=453962 RepID=A0ABV7M4M2_9GAMM|nr:hypothetical protein [Halomonas lutea]GHA87908.1 hypothetical protein GCM10007159_06640 [Halomonas lutea]